MLQWLFLSFNISPPETLQLNVLKNLQPKTLQKSVQTSPHLSKKQYNFKGNIWVPPSHPNPSHPNPPPPITKVLAPESRQKVGSPYHYDHPKEFPALSSGFWMFFVQLSVCVCVCVFFGSCWKGPGFSFKTKTHTRGATSQEKPMKEERVSCSFLLKAWPVEDVYFV